MTTTQPYGTPEAPRLAVHGEAHLDVDPELARITVTVTARGTNRRTTLDDLTHRNTHIITLVKSYGDAVEKLETSAFSLSPELTKHGRGERVKTYRGTACTSAELTDFTALGELTTRLADLDLTRVDGPWWSLRPNSPAHSEVRRRAVHQAVARAREYADALGTTLAALIELSDPGAENTAPAYGRPAAAGMAFRSAAPGSAEPTTPALDLEPQRQSVHARVNARFIMTPPAL
ncbi:SIMPL domain-containing protein [Streptomyces sp. NPDC059928]|uniref:SIMPL domain-containing protein n=1 Tax=unclassified Streptomyces TaxID=2593676 RepID=UPI003658F27D